jgi:hypothetical protein
MVAVKTTTAAPSTSGRNRRIDDPAGGIGTSSFAAAARAKRVVRGPVRLASGTPISSSNEARYEGFVKL